MSREFHYEPNRRTGSLLASFIVGLLGLVGAGVVVAGGGGDPMVVFSIFGCTFGVLVGILWLGARASQTATSIYHWVFSQESRPSDLYVPRPRPTTRTIYGTNTPPSLDQIKDAKDAGNTWVPSQATKYRSRRSRS